MTPTPTTTLTERLDQLLRRTAEVDIYNHYEITGVLFETVLALRDVAALVEGDARQGMLADMSDGPDVGVQR